MNKIANYFSADICKVEQINKAVSKCLEEFGTIDILINNAGILRSNLVSEMPISEWDVVIKTNLNGYFYVTRSVLPIMLKNKIGHIINIGSDLGKQTSPGGSAYCASKFGVRAFTDALSKEVIDKSIKVTLFSPGAMFTSLQDHVKNLSPREEREKKFLNVKDVAEIILFILTRPYYLVIDEIYLYSLKAPFKRTLKNN